MTVWEILGTIIVIWIIGCGIVCGIMLITGKNADKRIDNVTVINNTNKAEKEESL